MMRTYCISFGCTHSVSILTETILHLSYYKVMAVFLYAIQSTLVVYLFYM